MRKTRQPYILLGRTVGIISIIIVGVLLLIGGQYSQLAGYFVYMSIACTLIPLPTPPYVIGMGSVFHPGIVAFVGAIGSCLAGLMEYYLIIWLFSKTELEQKLQENRVFQKFARFFQRAAFACLIFAGFSVIPFEPFRFAAILIRYPMPRYLLSIFVGRFPRYYLIAMIGEIYQIPRRYLIIMIAVLVIIPVASHYINKYLSKQGADFS